jgi:hypothetical protein
MNALKNAFGHLRTDVRIYQFWAQQHVEKSYILRLYVVFKLLLTLKTTRVCCVLYIYIYIYIYTQT